MDPNPRGATTSSRPPRPSRATRRLLGLALAITAGSAVAAPPAGAAQGRAPCPGPYVPTSASPPVRGDAAVAVTGASTRWVTVTSLDGLSIRALMGTPTGSGPFPAVVLAHGGFGKDPQADMVKKLASAGFLVIDPDYRDGDIGGREVDDVVAAGRYLLTQPTVRTGGVGVMGTSHGAAIAALAVARFPGEFAAAALVAGASDWACIHDLRRAGADPLADLIAASMGGTPEEAWPAYVERSPVYQAGRIAGPVYVTHSERDTEVPIGQSQNLVDAMRAAGRSPVWRPTTTPGHGFLQKQATSGRDWQDLLRFLAQHLPAAPASGR